MQFYCIPWNNIVNFISLTLPIHPPATRITQSVSHSIVIPILFQINTPGYRSGGWDDQLPIILRIVT